MNYQVTASRKRPKNFQSMVGQEFVSAAISHSLQHESLANAYLFTGPRGVGKTSSARILATCLNCLSNETLSIHPCGTCTNCIEIAAGSNIDVIEIDGASNTSVNDIREIKDEILFPPSHSRFKIYIIDEVHMLSTGAFNALLKTIEEPPTYVKFIFATTENHKIPATIKSRCQQFNFKLITIDLIKKQLEEALTELDIHFDDDALFWLAKEAKGSMRDAYTLLDQAIAISQGSITLQEIKDKMGFAGIDDLNLLLERTLRDDMEEAIEILHTLFAKGISAEQILHDLTHYFHALLLIKHGVQKESLLGFPLQNFSTLVQDQLSLYHVKVLLQSLFQIYKGTKFSINVQFEIELFLSELSSIQLKVDPVLMLQELRSVQHNLLQMPTATAIASDPVSETIPQNAVTHMNSPEKADQSLHLPELIHEYLINQTSLQLPIQNIQQVDKEITLHARSAQEYQQLTQILVSLQKYIETINDNSSWNFYIFYDKLDLIHKIFHQ
ncbi:DNA polymerase III subunit gamma/tau [Entomospira entomophila]|uniref:DNA polymerase III subunit gamma/tau n=1 Tax=Entomospira entomophila TaxID=2719988 RepID=A0A968KR28_9SPIO|nr:DNA polymerase III subunit gamma/tau [Entomospira entomophilus]NIZ40379.1 DNA polymerase III subunit gamma/tau [Entomospira entomophilus]WDI35938.1 DNA polymerase III subunit gamma/tau [Entomospira entomophilus]